MLVIKKEERKGLKWVINIPYSGKSITRDCSHNNIKIHNCIIAEKEKASPGSRREKKSSLGVSAACRPAEDEAQAGSASCSRLILCPLLWV